MKNNITIYPVRLYCMLIALVAIFLFLIIFHSSEPHKQWRPMQKAELNHSGYVKFLFSIHDNWG